MTRYLSLIGMLALLTLACEDPHGSRSPSDIHSREASTARTLR